MLNELYFHVQCEMKVQPFTNALFLTSGCLCTASFSSLQTEMQTINMSFYFLENTECVHNSNLCCFIVSDVHQFEALLILVTLPCVSIIKSGFRIMSSQQGIVIMAINLSVHSISVCYCSSFLGVNYRRDFLLLKSRGGDRWKCNKNELLAVVECTYPKNSFGLCSSLFAA